MLAWQNFYRDKHLAHTLFSFGRDNIFVTTKDVFCRYKYVFVATNTCLPRQNWYVWQLQPMIVNCHLAAQDREQANMPYRFREQMPHRFHNNILFARKAGSEDIQTRLCSSILITLGQNPVDGRHWRGEGGRLWTGGTHLPLNADVWKPGSPDNWFEEDCLHIIIWIYRLWSRESGGVIVRDTRHAIFFCHATTTGHRVRFVDGLPGASLPPEPDALHKSLTFYLLVFCSSEAVAV